MRRSSSLFPAAAVFLVLILAAASPLQRSHLMGIEESLSSLSGWNPLRLRQKGSDLPLQEKRQTVNCTDLSAAFNSQCWQELQLSNFLLGGGQWGVGWNKSTRVCDSQSADVNSNDGTNCCLPGEAWTTCFLRLAQGGGTQDCSQINAQFCSMPSENALSAGLADSIRPEVQYIQKNIYALNDFFTTYYNALTAAQSDASTTIQGLINEVDPIKPATFNLITLLTALSVGLAFLGAPSIAVTVLGLSSLAKSAAQVLTISLQQAPSTAKALWPTGTQNSQSVQIGNLEAELGNSTNQLADMVNNAVQLLMSDMPTFVKFVESGQYSGAESLSLPSKVEGLDYALRTYMTSEAFAQNGWVSTPMIGPFETVQDVENAVIGGGGGDCTMGNNSVCTNGQGSALFWSQPTGRVYAFANENAGLVGVDAYQLLQDTVNNNWAILQVLFDGSFNCTQEGNFGDSIVNFNWDGTLDIACISQLPTKVECGAACPVALINNQCPFPPLNNDCDS
ncbi:hypothetical protein HO173_010498 [Letharia columbiana]|uniref:Uncharacterized protein n=1 Tax=Letharia columbiana TaxID=112416 RepID=A0A8H6FMN2_9LECA|nr:uncharacterized protein HO173_010498 [Letharia columbiana]KAF6231355.1 hypothetical protein HO173_010498 [Letharia columbiana]